METPTHNTQDRLESVRIDDTLLEKIVSGCFCSVCGIHHGEHDGPCPCIHNSDTELWLAPFALDLQAWVIKLVSPLRTVEPIDGVTPAQYLCAYKCLILRKLCWYSMALLAQHIMYYLSSLRGDKAPIDNVDTVEEIEVAVRNLDGEGWNHWVFRFRLESGERWVFDPTGVQFGPHWAVVERWDDYLRRFGAVVRKENKLETAFREWQADERKDLSGNGRR